MAGNVPNQNANRIFVVLLFNVHPGSARFVGTTTRRAETENSRPTSGAPLRRISVAESVEYAVSRP